MRIFIIFVLFFSIGELFGQSAFNQVYEMNAPASAFHNVTWDGENIVVAGTARIDSASAFCASFVK